MSGLEIDLGRADQATEQMDVVRHHHEVAVAVEVAERVADNLRALLVSQYAGAGSPAEAGIVAGTLRRAVALGWWRVS